MLDWMDLLSLSNPQHSPYLDSVCACVCVCGHINRCLCSCHVTVELLSDVMAMCIISCTGLIHIWCVNTSFLRQRQKLWLNEASQTPSVQHLMVIIWLLLLPFLYLLPVAVRRPKRNCLSSRREAGSWKLSWRPSWAKPSIAWRTSSWRTTGWRMRWRHWR